MDKEWVERKNKEYKKKFEKQRQSIMKEIQKMNFITEDEKKEVFDLLNQWKGSESFIVLSLSAVMSQKTELLKNLNLFELDHFEEDYYSMYLDSEPMEFEGDIIITDPCYIMKKKPEIGKYPFWKDYFSYEDEKQYPDYIKMTNEEIEERKEEDSHFEILMRIDPKAAYSSKQYKEENERYEKALENYREANLSDWELCNCGSKMEVLGIHNYITRDTLYGDWSCTTYNLDTKEPIGEFCADAGLVSVFLLDEVLKYNPDFDYHLNRLWTTTLIKNFKGTIQFVVKEIKGAFDETTEYYKKGETWIDYEVEVIGHGIDTVTGQPLNFVGNQTGL